MIVIIGTDTGVVKISVIGFNDMPSANNQSVWTNEDENKSITLKGMDIDHNDNLTYHVV